MAIECDRCQGTDFHVIDGATYCSNCMLESQEHGQETVVDEETLGAFGDHAGSIKSKSIGKKRKSRSKSRDKYKISYTSLSIFTYTLKGWVQDAINELGVDPELEKIVFALWARYLTKIEMAFVKKPTLSRKPGFRDMQVKITNRKKLVTPTKLGNFIRKLKEPGALLQLEEVDYSEESADIRRKRQKAKRKYLDSIASSFSETESVMSTSYASSISETDDYDETSDDHMDENDPEIEKNHMFVLSRCTDPKLTLNQKKSPEVIRRKVVFAIFSLGMLLLENNTYSLSDLIRYAKFGVIMYDGSSQHVPPCMKIKDNYDLAKHTGISSHLSPLDHLMQRRMMARLGSLLQLNQVNFGQLDCIVRRYLKDFSLPKYLAKMLQRSLGNCEQLYNLEFSFEKYQNKKHYKEENANPVIVSDIRAVALILFSLKDLYGLDDVSEYHKRNKDCFDIIEWIELSRKRAFLACKHSSQLHKYFHELFPHVKMTSASWYAYLQSERRRQSEMRNVQNVNLKRKFYVGEADMAKDLAGKLYMKHFQQDYESATKETFDCRLSKTPLFDFARHYIQVNEKEEPADVQDLQNLLAMRKTKIQLKFASENSEKIEVQPPFVFGRLPSANERKNENVVFNNDLKPNVGKHSDEKLYNYRPLYWRATLARFSSALDKHYNHTKDANSHILSMLPENFTWILRYFSSVMDIKPSELYVELLKIEDIILKNQPDYFGPRIRAAEPRSSHVHPDFKYRLSMSS